MKSRVINLLIRFQEFQEILELKQLYIQLLNDEVSLCAVYAENPKNIRLLRDESTIRQTFSQSKGSYKILLKISAFTGQNFFERVTQKERELGIWKEDLFIVNYKVLEYIFSPSTDFETDNICQ